MDEVVIDDAGPRFIAKVWGEATKRQRIALIREDGWPLPTGHYVEIEFAQREGTGRVHGMIVRIDGREMVIDGHLARHPMKVWSVP